jgi:uncharacterized OB-fold protein/acyl dehydratase
MTGETASALQQARALVGKEYGPYIAWDPVNAPMIRQWCDALGVENPAYQDAEYAAQSQHGGLVAPPTMLNAWLMRGYGGSRAAGSAEDDVFEAAKMFVAAGYEAVVATNSEQEYQRYLRPGDHLTSTVVLESISDEKRTALGKGHFITVRHTYRDQAGEVVGTMRFTNLQYRPAEKADSHGQAEIVEVTKPPPPQPGISQDTQFFWDGLKEDQLLIQRCTACGVLRHPPGPVCTACHSFEWDTVRSSGRGRLYSFVVMHHPKHPAFDYPHIVGLVALKEGTRLVAPIIGVTPETVAIGLELEVVFDHVEGEHRSPMFRPVSSGS